MASAAIHYVRRGLPRAAGGDPWPDRSALKLTPTDAHASPAAEAQPATTVAATATSLEGSIVRNGAPASAAAGSPGLPPIADVDADVDADALLQRRGLPRTPGGDPWPPPRAVPFTATAPVVEERAAVITTAEPIGAPETDATPGPGPLAHQGLPREPDRERRRYRGRTLLHWAGIGVIGGGGLLLLGAVAVLFVRWLLSSELLQSFLTDYPGEYQLPEWAPVGIPWWLSWAHFFNVFLMVLIIRSGFQIRTEKRPTAFWTPKWNPQRKISLTIWFHQSLDLLWLLNGAIFVVLLVITGQWVRIVPTSWEVFPNALSAGLQYVSLDWPTENGWVSYNSLQQLTYFATVFLAAPVAVATGVRMSGLWPKNARRLNQAYPIELARAIHFPVMLYFVVFIIFHVTLVLATGALRNLNHIYAGQDVVNWTGFWIFAASLLVIVGSIFVARPLVIAPIASLFGRVGR